MSRLFKGYATVLIQGFDVEALSNDLLTKFDIYSLEMHDEDLTVSLSINDKSKLFDFLDSKCFAYTLICEKGAILRLSKYKKRYGLIIGSFLSLILAWYMSNTVIKTQIIFSGEDDAYLTEQIISVLDNFGIHSGAFIPSVDFQLAEQELYSVFDNISWVSIGNEGSVVTVNVSIASDKDNNAREYYPSNIVANRDGIIVDARVLAGQLEVFIGSAVSNGEILVSGVVESRNGQVYYYHSIGELIAEFEEEYILIQDLIEVTQQELYFKSVKTVKFFDLTVPLGKAPTGNYTYTVEEKPLIVFGIPLPISIATYNFYEVVEDLSVYTVKEATDSLMQRVHMLEKGILGDFEIMEREISESVEQDKIIFTVCYKLRGDIGKQQRIFAK